MVNKSAESSRRDVLWNMIVVSGGPQDVPASKLRDLLVYSGARGIFTDATQTGGLAPDGGAVTLTLLHTGKTYPDDLSDDGIVYHFPSTGQPGKDAQEVAATKACAQLQLPVFVITTSKLGSSLRDVRRGWVLGWDEDTSVFYVEFGETEPKTILLSPPAWQGAPFKLRSSAATTNVALAHTRPGQAKFKFDVFAFYGSACCVCDLAFDGLLDAAHLCDKRSGGSDDPRNGLVLCALHHRAMDRNYFGIDPTSLTLVPRLSGPDLAQLAIGRENLLHLSRRPHEQALAWRWNAWIKSTGQDLARLTASAEQPPADP